MSVNQNSKVSAGQLNNEQIRVMILWRLQIHYYKNIDYIHFKKVHKGLDIVYNSKPNM